MKYLLKSLLTVATFVLLLQSCVNRDYDFDNMDTTMVVRIPPIMLGSIERIELANLDELPIGILPPNIDAPPLSVVKSYTLYDLFDEGVVDNFFFDGAGAAEIEAKSVNVRLPLSGATIDLFFNVLDDEGEPLSGVNIPHQRLSVGQNQNLRVGIDAQSMRFMSNAKSLKMVMLIAGSEGATLIDGNSYLELHNVIIRTGGIRFDLFD